MNALPSAVFLDRDGTIIVDREYISQPDDVELIEGAAEAIARINGSLVPVVVITNQSGIGRGYFTESDYQRVKERLDNLLAQRGARIDATYLCPHKPEDHCQCRKPGRVLFDNAATDLGIDLRKALLIGDRFRDIEPAVVFGARGVLVPGPHTAPEEVAHAVKSARVADSLATALDWYLCTN